MSASPRQLQALAALNAMPEGVSLRQLGDKLKISHVSVVALLKRLEKQKLVTLKPPRRLTEKGRQALKNAADDLQRSISAVA